MEATTRIDALSPCLYFRYGNGNSFLIFLGVFMSVDNFPVDSTQLLFDRFVVLLDTYKGLAAFSSDEGGDSLLGHHNALLVVLNQGFSGLLFDFDSLRFPVDDL